MKGKVHTFMSKHCATRRGKWSSALPKTAPLSLPSKDFTQVKSAFSSTQSLLDLSGQNCRSMGSVNSAQAAALLGSSGIYFFGQVLCTHSVCV